MTTTLEKVARAIAQQIQPLPYDELPPHRKAVFPRAEWSKVCMDDIVRAAIQALMSPGDEAIIAGGWHFGAEAHQLPQDDHHDAKAVECFNAMLQAILDEEKETADAD